MAIRLVVTRGYGNGTFSTTIRDVVSRGYDLVDIGLPGHITDPAKAPRFSQRTFLELVQRADPEFQFEGNHPIVYNWPVRPRRDSGSGGGPYQP